MAAPRITVVGAGFAGLTALRTLRRGAPAAELTLVAPVAELHYLPGTIWLPSGRRRREDLVVPLGNFLRRQRIRFHAARASGLSDDGRTLLTDAGEVANDGLVIASGARFIRKLPGIEHAIVPCEGVAAGEAIRDRLAALAGGTLCFGFASNPQEPIAMRGGPIFEFVFGIDTLLRRQGRRDRFRLVFFSPSPTPGQRLGERAVGLILAEMAKRGIDTVLGEKPKAFEAAAVQLEHTRIGSDLTLFMPGLTGPAWLDATRLPRSPGGLVQGDAQCRVAGFACTYAAGDGASLPGPEWMPKQAHQADLQAAVAARNLLRELAGETPRENFRAELSCIIDSLDRGMLVTRHEGGGRTLEPMRIMHWAKAAFEKIYLRRYR
ncbi:MAG: FAD-dependent oxidoreductase [Dokdonella sp.]|uniref:NAD(P)/FAD-dependent oxidoreductase n=1 Tax=Dokdonella sp. TaxID=2291710 RepID=UPI0025C64F7A|nr:FAD-dependent oxidoreductase [Dokdonella sp.]MBX3700083.1 FAD-dependent oxidoreductase [Dokdonella sp.]MCW5577873.1 FAD-dependent oxidoreductase [Dokdonella sp.]